MAELDKQIRVMKMSPKKGGPPDAFDLGPIDYARQLERENKIHKKIKADRNRYTFHHRPSTPSSSRTKIRPHNLKIILPDDHKHQVDPQQPPEAELWELIRDSTKAKHEAIIAQQTLEKKMKLLLIIMKEKRMIEIKIEKKVREKKG